MQYALFIITMLITLTSQCFTFEAGVGMTALQLPFDFRFAWVGAKLTFPFVRRGIVPEGTPRRSQCDLKNTNMLFD